MGRVTYDFEDETVIVTGASSGIGRAIARRFGEAGAHVINADQREEPKADDEDRPTHEVIEDEGGKAEYVGTDVSDRGDLESVVEGAREFGGVDVMVNNAGMQHSAPLLEFDPEDFEALYQVNVKGMFFGSQMAAESMLDDLETTADLRAQDWIVNRDCGLSFCGLFYRPSGSVVSITFAPGMRVDGLLRRRVGPSQGRASRWLRGVCRRSRRR